jgi:hypothetical protein
LGRKTGVTEKELLMLVLFGVAMMMFLTGVVLIFNA